VNNNHLAEWLEQRAQALNLAYIKHQLLECASALRNAQGEREAALREVLALPKYVFDAEMNPDGGPDDCAAKISSDDSGYGYIEENAVRALLTNKPETEAPYKPANAEAELDRQMTEFRRMEALATADRIEGSE
jgi:hypothetical protein